jgi:hypothetical protein
VKTTLWQIIRLAWYLYRNKGRKYERIGQALTNAHLSYGAHTDSLFYVSNNALLNALSIWRDHVKSNS